MTTSRATTDSDQIIELLRAHLVANAAAARMHRHIAIGTAMAMVAAVAMYAVIRLIGP